MRHLMIAMLGCANPPAIIAQSSIKSARWWPLKRKGRPSSTMDWIPSSHSIS